LRIIRLETENIKRLKAIDITPNKYIVKISGGNGAGKSSVLDAIEYALMGTRSVPSTPVRKGAKRAIIKVDFGEIVVIRRMSEEGSKRGGYLTIEGKDGKMWKDPDDVLKSLMGAISFDPLGFLNMEAKKQFETLAHISMPDVDLDAMEAEAKADYERRTIAKKERDALQLRRDAIHVPEGLPAEKYDEAAIVKELQEASEYNATIEKERLRRKGIEDAHAQRVQTIVDKRKELENLKHELANLEANAKETIKTVAGWKELEKPRDAAELGENINQARLINAAIDRAATRAQLDAQMTAKQQEWEALDEAVKAGVRKKDEALAQAKYPIEGLGFDTVKREVVYNDLPFDQASHAEQMKTSMAIGMAINPKLRIMRIKDGSLLDDKTLAIVSAMAEAHDFQVWIECVSTTGKVGIYLEDGEVKAVNEDEPPAKPTKTRKRKEPANA
jgi:hypothetical protein